MQYDIDAEWADKFASAFYKKLMSGATIADAVSEGRGPSRCGKAGMVAPGLRDASGLHPRGYGCGGAAAPGRTVHVSDGTAGEVVPALWPACR